MFCKSCGSQLPDGAKSCSTCGAAVEGTPVQQPNYAAPQQPNYAAPQQPNYGAPQQPNYGAPQQPNYGAPQQPNYAAPQQPNYGAPQQPNYGAPQQPNYGAPQQPNAYQFNNQGYVQQLPMNWFKFVIYFQLFANAVLNLVMSIVYITGSHYGGGYMTQAVYSYFGGMKGLDIITGILTIGLAVLAFYTRFRLSAFRKDAIKWLMITYAANIAVSLIYLIGAIIITGLGELIDVSTVVSLISNGVLIALSAVYFGKRKHMFVN